MRIIVLALITSLSTAAWAAGLQKATLHISEGEQLVILVRSGDAPIASVKIVKPGTLNIEAGSIGRALGSGAGQAPATLYSADIGSKAVFLVEDKPVLSLSGDSMTIQTIKPRPEARSHK